jgi:hypothetical protein
MPYSRMLHPAGSHMRCCCALTLLLAGVGCDGVRGSGTRAQFQGDMNAVSADSLLRLTTPAEYDHRDGAFDAQRLALKWDSTMSRGVDTTTLMYGPLATIYPLGRLESISDDDFKKGSYAIAYIQADGDYPKLGIERGDNYWWVGRDSAWMVSSRSVRKTPLPLKRKDHPDPKDQPLATVRWLWSNTDEGTWGRCGTGCCVSIK